MHIENKTVKQLQTAPPATKLGGQTAEVPATSPQPGRTRELSAAKKALLEQRLRGAGSGAAEEASIPRRARPERARLSYAQQRLWFLDQLEPNSPLYNMSLAARLRGPLNVPALQQSISTIVARHEVLRTRYVAIEGQPWQEIDTPRPMELPVADLSGLGTAEREAELTRELSAEARRPFALARDLMIRARVLRLGENDHVLLLSMHHIASDAWSYDVLFQELAALYEAALAGREAKLPELPIQYADFSEWQNQEQAGARMQSHLAYWKRALQGAPELLELPLDRPRPAVQRFRGQQRSRQLPADLTAALNRVSQQEGVTLFMLLLAAFKVLLFRLTRQEDILVGAPIAGRNRLETERLIGFFVNTLALRDNMGGNPPFREVLRRARQTILDAYSHQEVPLDKLVEELRPERTASHAPLIQVMFALQAAAFTGPALSGVSVELLEVDTRTAKFDLMLMATPLPEGLLAQFEYNEDLFEPETMDRWLGHFETLLQQVAANPEQRLSELPLLAPEERRRMLEEWNQTRREYPREQSVAALFERQAGDAPTSVAVVEQNQSWTYQELNTRANQLAHYLAGLGVKPETRVGVHLDRGAELIVTLLAILKAGGAYLPLDRGYPKDRLAFMLADAQAPVVITEHRLLGGLPTTAARLVCLDTAAKAIAQESRDNPARAADGGNLAYVIYTSGSTGKPKGVCVPHRAINRLVLNTNYAPLGPGDVVAQVSNCSFDAATWEIWGALLNGARLAIIPTDALLSPGEFSRLLDHFGVSAIFLTTGLFNQLAAESPGMFRRLRYLLIGGEAVDPKTMAAVLRAAPPEHLLNAYGPTETTTFAVVGEVRAVPEGALTVPIGRPIANTTAYILDAHLQPVPIGVSGELYLGGDGVARGYLGCPELTAERFIHDPFGGDPAGRLYKTGDLARYLPNGGIDYLGRMDQQVKIRGFRVELGEIESVLSRHPSVRQCVVTARPDAAGVRQLVAYVAAEGAAAAEPEALRKFILDYLPEFMAPAFFVFLPELPLSAHGKVDRRALPAPECAAAGGGEKAEPRDAVEARMRDLWETVLDVRPIGIHDKFFALGGHSLLAVRLLAKIESAFGQKLSVASVFQHPTVARLAAALRESQRPPIHAAVVEIQGKGSKPPLFLVHGVGGGMLWGYGNLARHLGEDQPVYAFRSRGLDGQKEFDQIEALAAHYVAELRKFQPRGPYYLGGYCFGGTVAYEMACQLHARGEPVALLALFNANPPNSSYTRVRWTPVFAVRFLINVAKWALYTWHWTPEQRRNFALWKGRLLLRRLRRWASRIHPDHAQTDIGELVDLSQQSAEERALWETHIRALLAYHPRPYAGRATLFRSPVHVLLCSYDPRYGWGDLVQGGVEVRIVPGAHETIMQEPQVRELAAKVKWSLETARESCRLGLSRAAPPPCPKVHPRGLLPWLMSRAKLPLRWRQALSKLGRPGGMTLLMGLLLLTETSASAEAFSPLQGVPALPLTASLVWMKTRFFGGLFKQARERLTRWFPGNNGSLPGAREAAPRRRPSRAAVMSARDLETRRDATYPELFESQARSTPSAIAVRCGEAEWTYAELDARAEQLARHLQQLGAGSDVLVAVALDRSRELAAALLGVLKAGGAYLPLDPSYPPQRLAQILEDARPAVLITRQTTASRLAALPPKVICLDAFPAAVNSSQAVASERSAGADPDDLAYVIYTSGSTGQPKGVQITHRALVNHNLAMAEAFELRPSDRVLQFGSLSFDLSLEELLPTWLAGGTVVFRSEDMLLSMARFMEVVARERLSVLNLPTAFWHELVQSWRGRELPECVRLVVIGGESARADLHRVWKQEIRTRARLINTYGPTETTITSTLYVADRDAAEDVLPIGRPIANTRAYVLDSAGQPAPAGEPGELHLGGAGVARGYLNRPDLTAERFVTDPFSSEPRARMYRTGDWVRRRPDGNLEFLGRRDTQVKIRGYRVELGEIEAALRRHPSVKDAVVALAPEPAGRTSLMACVVPWGTPASAAELAGHLERILPDFMVPEAYATLDCLPLTPGGKVDRQALPPPRAAERAGEAEHSAPRSPLEAAIAEIWREALGVDQVGRNDHFFRLGGRSLQAMRVAARLQERLNVELPPIALFETPTVAALAAALALGGGAVRRRRTPLVAHASRAQAPPLSLNQQRLWLVQRLEPHSALYNVPQPVRLRGPLLPEVLERSLNEIARRHETLRTRFPELGGQPAQEILSAASLPLRQVDLRPVPPAERESELRRQLVSEALQPFDLEQVPPVRALLARLDDTDQVLLATFHHLITDAWSVNVFLGELAALYEAFAAGRPSPLPEPAIQYADYAAWQRQCLEVEVLEEQLGYWRRQLAGAPALLEWPADHPRPARQSHRGARHPVQVEPELAQALQNLGENEHATLFMTLLAAWQTLAARVTGRDDILVGSPSGHRLRSEFEPLIGFFVNTLVLRTDLAGDPTFRELLRRARETTLGAFKHQNVPFDKVVEALQPARDPSYHPLFQTMLVWQDSPERELKSRDLKLEPFALDTGLARFDLTLELVETSRGLEGWIEYATDLFEAPTIARLAGNFQTLLRGIAANPDQRLSSLPLLSPAERRQVVEVWNATQQEFPRDVCIHHLFEAQVRRTPEAVALVGGQQRLTYAELNAKADQIARRLRELGVGPETLVGLHTGRSPAMVAALLGILKAGGAYVPLDPEYPAERLDQILRDADVSILLNEEPFLARLARPEMREICLDKEFEACGSGPELPLSNSGAGAEPKPENLAYVIYTSGSTGQPKGVAVEHRSVVNLLYWAKGVYSAEDLAGVLASTSISFDVSVFELLVPLSWGGAIILAENIMQLPDLAAARQVTLVSTVPTAMMELLRGKALPGSVRVVNLAGEPLSASLADQIYQAQPAIQRVYDLYGPTEDTVFSSFALRRPGDPATIGRPLPNKQFYILSPQGQPMPIGAPGELFIGGAGLAREYLRQPELTAGRFSADPFSGRPGARLYRTGDLARLRPDGNLEFLGRIDHQVKIRGFRIELGEIEHHLRRHPEVREAVVTAFDSAAGDKRLAAYLVARKLPPATSELREFLKKSLPDYMTPSVFMTLDLLPVTPSGKVDRQALPPPEPGRDGASPAPEPPRTETEQLLAGIWREVLELREVGVHDNFFELGGHSLMVIQVLSRVREAIQVDLPMRALFEAPTIAKLAAVIEKQLLAEIEALSEAEARRLNEVT